jgi:hypothetical protein
LQLVSPKLGVPFMALAIMVSTFGCVNGMTLMGARLYYAMAQDGLFFQSVGRLNRNGVPAEELAEGIGIGPCSFDQLGVGRHRSRGLHAVEAESVSLPVRVHGRQLHLRAARGSG